MSITYRIDRDRGVTFVLWSSVVTGDEFLAHVRRLTAEPGWPPAPGRKQLTDLRALSDHSSIDEAVMREAAAIYAAHPDFGRLKVAIVAGDTFDKASVFGRLTYQASVITFNSLNPACAWLGIDPAEATRALQDLKDAGPAS